MDPHRKLLSIFGEPSSAGALAGDWLVLDKKRACA